MTKRTQYVYLGDGYGVEISSMQFRLNPPEVRLEIGSIDEGYSVQISRERASEIAALLNDYAEGNWP